jgi:hypothetical protein
VYLTGYVISDDFEYPYKGVLGVGTGRGQGVEARARSGDRRS